jgi:hypothetical protein
MAAIGSPLILFGCAAAAAFENPAFRAKLDHYPGFQSASSWLRQCTFQSSCIASQSVIRGLDRMHEAIPSDRMAR